MQCPRERDGNGKSGHQRQDSTYAASAQPAPGKLGVGDVAAANQADVKRHGNEGIKALPIRRDKGFVGRLDAFR